MLLPYHLWSVVCIVPFFFFFFFCKSRHARGFTSDRDAAVGRLEDGELDAVVVFPTDALDQILGGESAKIEVLHEKLDPIQQAAIDIASRLAVQEVNASVLERDRRRRPGGAGPGRRGGDAR